MAAGSRWLRGHAGLAGLVSGAVRSSLSDPLARLALGAGPAFVIIYFYVAGWARLVGPLTGAKFPVDVALVESPGAGLVLVVVVARRLAVAAEAVELALLALVGVLVSINAALLVYEARRGSSWRRGTGGLAAAAAPAFLASLGCAGGCGGVSMALLAALAGAGTAVSLASTLAGYTGLLLASSAAMLSLSLAVLARRVARRRGLRIEVPRRGWAS